MELIPAIDLLGGNCVRLNKGNYDQVTKFSSNPLEQALQWQEEGASRLHLVDLDGARTGEPTNDSIIQEITSAIKIPIQVGGGIRTKERAESLLKYGVNRVIFGTIGIEEPELVKEIAKSNPGKIILGIDSKKGKVATRGWVKESEINATDMAKSFSESGIAAIITTDIDTDGTLNGPNLLAMRAIAEVSSVPVIASGGVGSIADLLSLLSLEHYGIEGVILGRALYEGAIDLKEASKAINQGKMQDVPSTETFFA